MDGMDASSAPQGMGKWKRRWLVLAASLAVVGACVAIRVVSSRSSASAQAPGGQNANAPRVGNQVPNQKGAKNSAGQEIAAVVNRREITRQELAQECLAGYGKTVLEALTNKYLIINYCEQQGIKIDKQKIDAEIERLAQKFGIPVDQWLQMLKDERGITKEQYANDIIWPNLALREVAGQRIQPTEQELQQAFEAQYGEAVKARLIVLDDPQKAQQIHAQLMADPNKFESLARKESIDPTSASMNGLIQPIRKHVGDPQIEAAAFSLNPGDISPVIEVHKQYAILKCEDRVVPSGIKMENVRSRIEEFVRERKMRGVAGELFKQLQESAQVVNVYNDPQKQAQMPGVAALVNGRQVTVHDLAEACIERHGDEVLERMIHRTLLEEELKKKKLAVTQKDIDAEIARAALAAGKFDPQSGRPDVDAWLKVVCEDQGVPIKHYVRDAVWPSAALKLIAGEVKVTQDDIEKGFRANYGERARVRAIVLDSPRHAQEVWQKARENQTPEFFGKLAEQYSIEPASRANEGRVPPIQQFGGETELEREAFAMKPGDISGIIQVGNKYIIVYLEEFTKPVQVNRKDVEQLIYEDIHEKKQRLAMGQQFERIQEEAEIDNFVAGTSHRPKPKQPTARISDSEPGLLPRRLPAEGNTPAGHQAPVQTGRAPTPGGNPNGYPQQK
jgi:parvulin-like peptidyl-prolyl isomerase